MLVRNHLRGVNALGSCETHRWAQRDDTPSTVESCMPAPATSSRNDNSNLVAFRLSRKLRQQLHDLCERDGNNRSSVIRQLLSRAIRAEVRDEQRAGSKRRDR